MAYQDAYTNLAYGGDKEAEDQGRAGDAISLGLTGFGAAAGRRGAVNAIAGVPDLVLNNDQYQAPQYSGDFNPAMYADPVAAKYQLVNEDPRTRDMQMQALQRLQQYGDQAANSQEAVGRYNAVSDANAVAGQREQAIRQQMAMRGQGGSAAEFAMQQQAAQGGADRAQSAGLTSTMQAALQRLQGTQAAMAGAGQLRGQDFSNAAYNNDVVNAFNMRNTDALNRIRAGNTDLQNHAGLRNLDARQGMMNNTANIGNANIDRDNSNRSAMYGAQMGKATATGNALNGQANGDQQHADAARRDAWGMMKDVANGFGGALKKKDDE